RTSSDRPARGCVTRGGTKRQDDSPNGPARRPRWPAGGRVLRGRSNEVKWSMSEMPVVLDTRVVTGCGGGPDKTILNSPRFLAADGYRRRCAYMRPPRDSGFEQLRRKAELCRAPLVSVADRGPWDWRVVGELLQICRRERVSIWHGHDYKSNALGL